MDLGLAGKVALLTGGSKGIGEAVYRSLIAEGARVVNVNRAGPEGEALQAEFSEQSHFVAADLCEPDACERSVRESLDRFGKIDIVINNAGVNDSVGLDAGIDAFRKSLERNLLHAYGMVHHSLAELKAHRGCIINIGSKVSVTGQGGTSGYAASKGGLNALTREWAVDLAPFGVRANAVIPAEAWTPLYEKWLNSVDDPGAARARIEQLIPLERRFTTAQELADMTVFLASPRSNHTTGQIIFVDGGYTHLDRKCTT